MIFSDFQDLGGVILPNMHKQNRTRSQLDQIVGELGKKIKTVKLGFFFYVKPSKFSKQVPWSSHSSPAEKNRESSAISYNIFASLSTVKLVFALKIYPTLSLNNNQYQETIQLGIFRFCLKVFSLVNFNGAFSISIRDGARI